MAAVLTLALLGLMLSLAAGPASAQVPGAVRWGQPVVLSRDVPRSGHTIITADPFGGLHVFWETQYQPFPQYPDVGGSIMYFTQNRAGQWSQPVDVFVSPGSYSLAAKPSSVADNSGMLYTVWTVPNYSLYFNRAPVERAGDGRRWSPALELDPKAQTPYILLGADQALNVFYLSTGSPPGVYYTRSIDHGVDWSRAAAILEFAASSPKLPPLVDEVMAVEDAQHVLHVLFYDPYQTGIFYASSSDAGATWSRPVLLDSQERGNLRQGPAWPSIGVDGQGTVVALWDASHDQVSCARYSRSSTDGGKSWGERRHVRALFS